MIPLPGEPDLREKVPLRKAVVLARGLGRRMRREDTAAALAPGQAAAAASGLKAMIPFGHRPFLDYLLCSLADAGFGEACLVIGPEHAAVREYYTATAPPRRIRVSFAVQEEPRGTADALLAAEEFAGSDSILAVNGDNFYPRSALGGLRFLSGPGTALFELQALLREGSFPEDRIRSFAVGILHPDGTLAAVVEKPDVALLGRLGTGALISMNCWRFPPAIFAACREVTPSSRGELELPSAVQRAMEAHSVRFQVVRCREGVLDLSFRSDIGEIARRLLGKPEDP